MTAFLFIPATGGTGLARRVDFANIGSLFTEVEPPKPSRDRHHIARVALMIIILLGAIGDTVLVARPGALTSCTTTAQSVTRL